MLINESSLSGEMKCWPATIRTAVAPEVLLGGGVDIYIYNNNNIRRRNVFCDCQTFRWWPSVHLCPLSFGCWWLTAAVAARRVDNRKQLDELCLLLDGGRRNNLSSSSRHRESFHQVKWRAPRSHRLPGSPWQQAHSSLDDPSTGHIFFFVSFLFFFILCGGTGLLLIIPYRPRTSFLIYCSILSTLYNNNNNNIRFCWLQERIISVALSLTRLLLGGINVDDEGLLPFVSSRPRTAAYIYVMPVGNETTGPVPCWCGSPEWNPTVARLFFFSFLFFFTPRDENRADRPNGKSHQARGRLLSSGRALQQPLEQKNDINTYNGRNPSRPLIPNTTKKKLIELLFQAALSFFPSSITLSGFLQNSQLC